MINISFFPFLETSLLNKKYERVWERKRRRRERKSLKAERELSGGTKEWNSRDL